MISNLFKKKSKISYLFYLSVTVAGLALPTSAEAAPTAAEEAAKTENDQIFQELSKFKKERAGTSKDAIGKNLKKLAEKRKARMLKLMESDPKGFLKNSAPQGLTNDLPKDIENLVEKDAEVEGALRIIQQDDFVNKRFETMHFVEGRDKKFTRLRFSGKAANLKADSVIKVKGKKLDENIAIAEFGGTSVTTVAAAPPALVSGVQKTIVMVGNFTDSNTPCSVDAINSTMFTGAQNVDKFYQEASSGNVSFAGKVVGTYTIPYSSQVCDYINWGTALDNAAKAQGVDLTQYTRKVYVLPKNTCAGGGYGYIGGANTRSWIYHCAYPELYIHELGHNLGMHHARTPAYEYGDDSDPMGAYSGYRHFNAANMTNTAWMPSNNVIAVQNSGTYTIDAIDAKSVNPQVLKIYKPDDGQYYYLGYRNTAGTHNNGLNSAYYDKVNIHTSPDILSKGTMLHSTLSDGGIFQDSTNGVKITQLSHDATKATVSIELATASCVGAKPTVSITPLSNSTNAGKALAYSVSVTNNNTSVCPTTTYQLSNTVPAYWTGNMSPTSLSLTSGASGSATLTVTSSGQAAEGSYNLQTSGTDIGNSTSNNMASATYVVLGDTVAPTVAITSPVTGATLSGTSATISATASDNVGVNSVEFYIDGKLVATDTTAPYSYSWSLTGVTGSHTIMAKATDTSGNSSSSSVTASIDAAPVVDNIAPTVAITSPKNRTRLSGSSVTINATANDNVGVASVEFYVKGVLKATDTTAPYSYIWNITEAAAGSYTIMVRAKDTSNNIASAYITAKK